MLAQIDPLRDRRWQFGVQREFQQRSQSAGGKHVDVAIEIIALNGDEEIAGCSGEGVVVISEPCVA